jgi:hypothetical protein
MRKHLGCLAIGITAIAASAQWSDPAASIPAYNMGVPTSALPAVLHGEQLTGTYFAQPYKVAIYKMAAKIPGVLHQQPCYCRCDKGMGHNSLHSCFEGLHGAECSTCMKEAVFSYQETKKGRTPTQIRAEIEQGQWMNVNIESVKF